MKHLKVFIASPGDVADEREIARAVVRLCSDRLGEHGGFVLEPVGWETHAAIDAERPQELINPLVRDCDLFVGILWSRFGTASGEAESGTAEEFQVALERHAETGGTPRIMAFFSEVDVPMATLKSADGIAQLQRVQQFIHDYEGNRRGLAASYGDVRDFERTLTEQLMGWCAEQFGVDTQPAVSNLDLEVEYGRRVVEGLGKFPVAGFETSLEIPIEVEKVYVPLRARIAALESRGGGADPGGFRSDEAAVRDFPGAWEFANRRSIRQVVVLGQPGSGKTTLLKHIAVTIASGNAAQLGLLGESLPVFVPLRRIDPEAELESALHAACQPDLQSYPPNFLTAALEQKRAVLLLDGLDEVADREARRAVRSWIERLCDRYPEARVVVTSRFAGYREARFNRGHLQLELEAFRPEDVRRFLGRWYAVVESTLHGDSGDVASAAKRAAESLAEDVLEHEAIRRLAVNPLMLQIIALVHRKRGRLPERRVELYDECVNVLLETWLQAKDLDLGFSARQARAVLQPLALWMHGETERKTASEDDLVAQIRALPQSLPADLDARAFLRTIRDRSGLLTGHDVDRYGFQHLSFQEFLAAHELHDQRDAAFLAEHFDESWWREVTRLFVGLRANHFSDLMNDVIRADKLVVHRNFASECVRDALAPSLQPLLEAACDREASSEVRYQALNLMASFPREKLEQVSDDLVPLSNDPSDDLSRAARSLLAKAGKAEALRSTDRPDAPPRSQVNEKDGTELLLVPGGPCVLGAKGQEDNPLRKEEIGTFLIARYPVTNAQYRAFLEANPEHPPPSLWDDEQYNQPEQPVVGVSWQDANGYCRWAGLRLPTECEWEKAARGEDGRPYPWGDAPPDETRANFASAIGKPTPVGSYATGASPCGAMDMAGNVWEWTASAYGEMYPRDGWAEFVRKNSEFRSAKTLRGGAFDSEAVNLRCAVRYCSLPDFRDSNLGFRCAQDPVTP